MIISIADLPVQWQTDCSDFVKDFVCKTDEQPVISVDFVSALNEAHGIQFTDKPTEHMLRTDSGELLFADSDWKNCCVFTLRQNRSEHSLPLAAICSRFAQYSALFLHASLVEYKGGGIIFAGYSGVGKTTQAQLWQKHMQAKIINGDKVFLRSINNSFLAYGCPWKGSSEYCLNENTPLKGIVVLRQSSENKITTLDTDRAIELFLPHIFLPHWDQSALEKALETFSKLIEETPVLLLECKPDEAAVKLTYSKVFGNG